MHLYTRFLSGIFVKILLNPKVIMCVFLQREKVCVCIVLYYNFLKNRAIDKKFQNDIKLFKYALHTENSRRVVIYRIIARLFPIVIEPIDKCSLPKDEGGCDSAIIKWYYNGERCEQFYYGGCKGNANRFESRRECEKSCMPSVIKGKLEFVSFIIGKSGIFISFKCM